MKLAPVPTLATITAWCREWQQRLRLQDWRVRIRFAKPFELQGNQANVELDRLMKAACIIINPHVRPDEPDDADEAIAPFEERVIHELVHLHFMSLLDTEKGTLQHTLMEQSTDALAWALYQAKYGPKKGADRYLQV